MRDRVRSCARMLGLGSMLALSACQSRMAFEGKVDPMRESAFFADGSSARPLVQGTVPHGRREAKENAAAQPTRLTQMEPPLSMTRPVLLRGQARYRIYCLPCHGENGDGQGMIVKRGLSAPPSFHEERLREAPARRFFDVITHGYGAMYPYASRVEPADRWAIIGYIRALQLGAHFPRADLSPADLQALARAPAPAEEKTAEEKK